MSRATVRALTPNGPTAETEEITPEKAREWLGRNTKNRPLKPRKIDQYARDMAAGRWRVTGEAIKFASDGRLLDGQNRLHAIVQADVSVRSLVVRGVDSDAQDVMDSGVARSAADALAMQGVTNATKVTGAARIAMCVRDGVPVGSSRYTNSEVQEWVLANLEITEAQSVVLGRRARLIPLTPAAGLYCAWRLGQVDAEAAVDFFDALAEGIGLPAGSPILALRRRLTGAYGATRRTTVEEQLIVTFRAWNFWRRGESLERVQSVLKGGAMKIPDPE